MPSPQDWLDRKAIIIDHYINQDMTMKKLIQEMKNKHQFNSTRMYTKYLAEWGIRKYLSAEELDDYRTTLLKDLDDGITVCDLDPDLARKLHRHCTEKRPDTDPRLLELLRLRSREHTIVASNTIAVHPTSDGMVSSNSVDDGKQHPPSVRSENTLHLSTQFSTELLSASDFSLNIDVDQGLPPSMINQVEGVTFDQHYNSLRMPTPLPQGPSLALIELLSLARAYYGSRTTYYARNARAGEKLPRTLHYEQSQLIWKSVKNAIYFLKKGDVELALPLLGESKAKIHDLCEMQSLDLLRELCDTLSFSNTSIRNTLRVELLGQFAQAASKLESTNSDLHQICLRLAQPWVCEDTLIAMLDEISQTAQAKLGLLDLEVHRLHRARIRLRRRQADLAPTGTQGLVATKMFTLRSIDILALESQTLLEEHLEHGCPSIREIMSERLYVLNLSYRPLDAFQLAHDIVARAEEYEESEFPSQQAVYELEDLAEIYEKLGQSVVALSQLQKSLAGALKAWVDRAGTRHIQKKVASLVERIIGS